MTHLRFVSAVDLPDPVQSGAAASDPAPWRRRVAVEMELLMLRPAPQDAVPAAEFPSIARPAAVRHSRTARRIGVGTFGLAAAAALAGVVFGAMLPGELKLPDLDLASKAPMLLAQLRPKVAPAKPVAPPAIVANPLPPAAPSPPPAVAAAAPAPPLVLTPPPVLALTLTDRPASRPTVDRPAPAPAARAPERRPLLQYDAVFRERLADAELTLAAAYGEAEGSGIPASLLRADRSEWGVIRAGAERRSPEALIDAYDARIEAVREMTDEALAASGAEERAALGPPSPRGRR